MAGPRNPELQRLLAILGGYTAASSSADSGFSGSNQSHYSSHHNDGAIPANANSRGSTIPGLGLLPLEAETPRKAIAPVHQQVPSHRPDLRTPQPGADRSKPTTPEAPDASTITTWPAALKHVTKHIATNEKLAERIRHLISMQHKHERQWWAGREAIVARQQGRTGASQQVAALLKSLGGKDMPLVQSDPKADQAELDTYDKKVYTGLVAMAADFDRQLRAMGVPFYSIKHELVLLEEGPEDASAAQGRIDKGELRELQKRMLQTLEDLFMD